MQQEVDEVLNAAVRDGTVPGVSGMVVDGDGILYRGNHGMANTAAGTLLASDSIFRISSWTKSVTTTALAPACLAIASVTAGVRCSPCSSRVIWLTIMISLRLVLRAALTSQSIT